MTVMFNEKVLITLSSMYCSTVDGVIIDECSMMSAMLLEKVHGILKALKVTRMFTSIACCFGHGNTD